MVNANGNWFLSVYTISQFWSVFTEGRILLCFWFLRKQRIQALPLDNSYLKFDAFKQLVFFFQYKKTIARGFIKVVFLWARKCIWFWSSYTRRRQLRLVWDTLTALSAFPAVNKATVLISINFRRYKPVTAIQIFILPPTWILQTSKSSLWWSSLLRAFSFVPVSQVKTFTPVES